MYKKVIIILMIILMLGTVQAALQTDLEVYYKLDETSGTNANEEVNNYDGTANDARVFTSVTNGIIDAGANFEQGNDYINDGVSFITDYPFTMNVWVETDTTGITQTLFQIVDSTVNDKLQGIRLDTAGKPEVESLNVSAGRATHGSGIADGGWHMITALFIADANRCLYVDGTYSTCNTTNINYAANDRIAIGYQGRLAAGNYTDGNIDEIGVWSRILTFDEITDLYNSGSGFAYPFSVPAVDANFAYTIDKVNSEIDFNDISTSTLTTIDDWNWLINGVSQSTDQNFTYTATEWQDINACLIIDNNDDTLTDTYCQQFNSGRFVGRITIDTYDETTGLALGGVNVNFNSTDYDVSNKIDLNSPLTNTSSTNYIFTFTKSGYGTRYYNADLNKHSDLNISFAMLATTEEEASNVSMKFFDDSGAIVANTQILIDFNNFTIGKRKTNAVGETSFYLNEYDTNYHFTVYDSTTWDTHLGLVQISRPETEGTTTDIDGNWAVEITGVKTEEKVVVTGASQQIFIIPNKFNAYNLDIFMVDANDAYDDTYGSRDYAIILKGDRDGKTYSLQPYLSEDLAEYQIEVIVAVTELSLEYAYVEFRRTEEGSQVTSVETGVGGWGTVNLIPTTNYWIAITDKEGRVRTFSGGTTGMHPVVTGQDLVSSVRRPIIVDPLNVWYNNGVGVLTVNPQSGTYDTNTYIRASYNMFMKAETDIIFILYKDGVLAGQTEVSVGIGTTYPTEYVWNWKMEDNDTDYNLVFYEDGTKLFNLFYQTRGAEDYKFNPTQTTGNQNITIILAILILTAGLLIGMLFNRGIETMFILSFIFVWLAPTFMFISILGIIYFISPAIKEFLRN